MAVGVRLPDLRNEVSSGHHLGSNIPESARGGASRKAQPGAGTRSKKCDDGAVVTCYDGLEETPIREWRAA